MNWKTFPYLTCREFEVEYVLIAADEQKRLRCSPFYWLGRGVGYLRDVVVGYWDDLMDGWNE